MLKRILLFFGAGISLFIIWFAVDNYRDAYPVAEENLHGLALSLTAAIESLIAHDPTLGALSTLHTRDIAFFALIDRKGVYRFHSNTDLVGARAPEPKLSEALRNDSSSAARITLGTGEKAYEFITPIYRPEGTLLLRLTLHTYRAETVIRQAKVNMTILLFLVVAGCMLSVILYRFAKRDEQHQLAMSRRESLAKLGEMGATLAHEIRNPLAGIKGYAQVIEKNPVDPRNSSFAHQVVTETLRLENLVNNLLAYAGSDQGVVSPLNLAELISATASLLRSEADEHDVKIVTESPANLSIIGNKDKLGQLLLNLGKNALQAMPDGGTFRITAEESGTNVLFAVSDSGQGISRENLPRIFEPFFTTKARGTGLGLALCRKIVEEHKGTINVESTVGKGTVVSITFPAPAARRD
jgi:two-component system sensor histidine kinase HydH